MGACLRFPVGSFLGLGGHVRSTDPYQIDGYVRFGESVEGCESQGAGAEVRAYVKFWLLVDV